MDVESFTPYLLHFVVLSVSLALIYLVCNHKSNKNTTTNLPLGSKGLPFIGETLAYIWASSKGVPEKFINDRKAKFSPDVFRTSLLGENMVVFCGSAGNKFIFSNQDKYVTSWWPTSVKKTLMFPSTTKTSAKDESNKLRSFLPPFLKPETLQHYVPIMDSMAKQHLDEFWSPFKQVKAFSLSKKYTFGLACHFFISLDDPVEIAKLAEPYERSNGRLSVPINLPGTSYNRAMKATKVIRSVLLEIVRKRHAEFTKNKDSCPQDLLTNMLLDRDENGEPMHEFDIVNKIIALFIASHETSSTAVAFFVGYLAEYPHIYEAVRKEQMEIAKSKAPGDLLKWEDIQRMKYSWCVACEAMRLLPPANGGFREAITDFTYKGFTIPKGWKTYWTVHSTNKNPQYYPEPEKFDPSRFEGDGPAPYTYVPFGGGPKMCPGKEFARLEILVFIHNLVTRFKLEKLSPNERITFIATPTPMEGLPIGLKPHQTPIA
ncbi:p450 domain-containing protein [Cephalotus follicularis]|uniref:p450 domain-containing protein n=1 Tax=Cephalotus follicularis TaxID=3775 RepID=A0A1Q3BKR7_CEPFO|nr:p450 domain-containing protein [Cephalotus follicularis]